MVTETTKDSAEKQAAGAYKNDDGKPGIYQGLISRFPRALWGVAEISTFGKNKYGTWDGWADVEDAINRYRDAEGRHLLKEAMGEEIDMDSKKLHILHKAWGALATAELYLKELEDGAN